MLFFRYLTNGVNQTKKSTYNDKIKSGKKFQGGAHTSWYPKNQSVYLSILPYSYLWLTIKRELVVKSFKLALLSANIVWLSACLPPSGVFSGEQTEYLTNDIGVLSECTTQTSWKTGERRFNPVPKSQANFFWKENNLPKGTLYYVCEGDKAVLPRDCQGKSLTTPELRSYWKKYDLPVGLKKFNCSSGVPKDPRLT
ncbi:MAG: hypothetical protein ACI9JO_001103 [Psychrobacter okhotskensis]